MKEDSSGFCGRLALPPVIPELEFQEPWVRVGIRRHQEPETFVEGSESVCLVSTGYESVWMRVDTGHPKYVNAWEKIAPDRDMIFAPSLEQQSAKYDVISTQYTVVNDYLQRQFSDFETRMTQWRAEHIEWESSEWNNTSAFIDKYIKGVMTPASERPADEADDGYSQRQGDIRRVCRPVDALERMATMKSDRTRYGPISPEVSAGFDEPTKPIEDPGVQNADKRVVDLTREFWGLVEV
ncbi:hypothetical protein BO70DRAFT_430911 [Aspergillus heteromorphus CBS 117.55]|uniref:Uncharacterized protein n=1 Tax=Aspergillus heteromorphus CBS 117.55 TaxID=1448321 RepID=A0A317VPB5_9EURO|nr:uncharacterized protein BO70DRAFT_430911 [Aspergillus heteromorphus CBS 117.55]PWY75459.1 hypothetical protein BO70DRAFT_430911 [Aspergillus heteromorphus CBS 117.55]